MKKALLTLAGIAIIYKYRGFFMLLLGFFAFSANLIAYQVLKGILDLVGNISD